MIVHVAALLVQCKKYSSVCIMLVFTFHEYRLGQHTGMTVVDIGLPQLSMHSIREIMGSQDLAHGEKLLCRFFDGISI